MYTLNTFASLKRNTICFGAFLPLLFLQLHCSSYVERPTQVYIEPESDEFWALPLPSDGRLEEDGSYNIEDWPGTDWYNDFSERWLRLVDKRVRDGWGLSSGVFVKLTGAIDQSTLPKDARASMREDASVFLVNIDEASELWGERIPIEVSIPPVDNYTPENLLAAIPVFGFLREPNSKYALVITEALKDINGKPLGRTEAFHEKFEKSDDCTCAISQNYSALKTTLKKTDLDADKVVGVAGFSTFDPNVTLLKIAAWTETIPLPEQAEPWVVAQTYESYQVLTSRFNMPVIQEGNRPYATEGNGAIVWGEDGNPVIQEYQGVRVVLSIPKSAKPESGFPLTMFLHGSGGHWYQTIDRGPQEEVAAGEAEDAVPGTGPAEWLARRGLATMGIDFSLHGDRYSPPDTTGLKLYNLIDNPDATIDNFQVAIMELLLWSRLLVSWEIDATLADATDIGQSGGIINFDDDRLSAMGQSMGSTLSVPWATVEPRVKAFVLSGAGGMLAEVAVSATEPFPLNDTLVLLARVGEGKYIHRAHPFIHTLQNGWDHIDPIVKAPYVLRKRHAGMPKRHVLMPSGYRDGYFAPRAQAALAVPLGLPLVGESAEELLPDYLDLANIQAISYPVQGNIDGQSAAIVHYAAPHDLGHYVAFNQEGARYQYTCFLASLQKDKAPVLPAANALNAECP
jgi:hypothetical protein